ncbi:diguanylate cyclase [Salinisphaera sp. S4-8]|uniref:EAL domain-containing protein n=1 Tax=Salinisphaera sp. S4-8 TaxID=633357 RepID=UPI00334086C1
MNQHKTASVPGTGVGKTLAVMAITAEDAVFERIRTLLDDSNDPVDLIRCEDPSQLGEQDAISGVAVIALHCHSEDSRARRELGLVHGLAGLAPVIVLDDGDAGLARADALEDGAFDVVPLAETDLLELRLRQALEIGRVRVELQDAAQRLNQTQRRLDVLLSHGQDARATLVGQRVADPSPAFARLIGVNDTESARGIDLLDRVAPHDRDRFSNALDQVTTEQSDASLVFDLTTHLNHRQSVRALLTPGVAEKGDERRTNVVLQSVDSERRTGEAARGPALDGRMALHSVLSHTVSRAKEYVLGMVFIAVDEISGLQDQFGLAESDLLLQEVGLYLLQAIRGEDRVFRFGAGEYVMIVERHSVNEIEEFAQSLHSAISGEVFGDDRHGTRLSSSLAYCVLSGGSAQNDARLQRLMDTVYELREDGGNACQKCVVDSGESTGDEGRDAWVERLREALDHDRFSLAYQGVTSLAGDSQPYFDVLLRYVDDRGALVRPGEFLPAAEQANMMPAIDRWVVQRAIDVIWQQKAKATEIILFVKLSPATIKDGEAFATWLASAIEQHPIEPSALIFSFREDDVRSHVRPATQLAESLTDSGFRVALTHYGSTPKAVQVLDRMPANFIKLAPDFARQMLGREQDERLAHIIASAREREIPLIAEQIEDANSMARLWQAGINYVQGHFIQEPDTEALAGDTADNTL